ncbi:MAG: O-antigen ligase family protein [Bacteroidota bacterium]
MTATKTNLVYVSFAGILLLIVNNIRSEVLVDTSFLPRFFILPILLLITSLLLFRKRIVISGSFFEIAFILFFLWNLLSSLWAIVPSEAVVQSLLIFTAFSVYIIVKVLTLRNSRFEEIFISFALVSMLFSFGLAFYKMSTLEFFDPYRINSVSANNNLYSGLLLISLPLALTGYSVFRGFRKYFSAAIATMSVFFIVIIQSRAVYLGLLFAALLSLIALFVRFRFLFTSKNLLTCGISLVFLSVGIFTFYSSLDQPRKNYFMSKIPVWQYFRSYDKSLNEIVEKRQKEKATLTEIPSFDYAGSFYENANLRVIFWKKSACLFASHPLLGTGAGNWRINIASCSKPDNPDHTFKNYTYSQPHNEWIGFLAELGVPGFLLAVIIFFCPVIIAFYRIFSRKQELPVAVVLYASFLAGFYLFACFDFPFKRIEHNVILFSIMAFLLIKVTVKGWIFTSEWQVWKYLRIFLIAGLIFTTALVVQRIRGEFFTLRMFRNEGKSQEKVILYGRKAVNCCYCLTPNTLPVSWFVGVAQFRQGNPESALVSFSDAMKITPYEVRVLNDYATALYTLNRVAEAKSELQKTLAIDPFFDDARYNLAAIHFYHGKRDSARILVEGCRKSQKKSDFLAELK